MSVARMNAGNAHNALHGQPNNAWMNLYHYTHLVLVLPNTDIVCGMLNVPGSMRSAGRVTG